MSYDLIGIFGAGLLTFVSPCVLPLIPIYLALLLGSTATSGETPSIGSRLSLFINTLFFSAGLTLVFIALGLIATWLGALLNEHRTELVLAGGLIIFLFGLKYLGLLQIGWLEREQRLHYSGSARRWQWTNSLILGVVFSLGWTPCVGPVLGSVLSYTATSVSDPFKGALYLAVYGAGFSLPLLVFSLLGDVTRKVLTKIRSWLPRLEKITGVILALVGLYLIFTVTTPPEPQLQPANRTQEGTIIEPALGQATVRPRLVEFMSVECSVCRQMIPTVALIERDCGGKEVEVVKVDLSQTANQALARTYQIRGVPTFVFLDRAGQPQARLVGYQTLSALRQALSMLTGERCAGVGTFTPQLDSTCNKGSTGQCH